jgi:hypothetical protein
MTKKLLYSPGYGAGWSTWEGNPEVRRFMVTYEPIIEFLEAGERFPDESTRFDFDGDGKLMLDDLHPILRTFVEECQKRFDTIPYLGGARDLQYLEVADDARVFFDEYDGNESPRFQDTTEWY